MACALYLIFVFARGIETFPYDTQLLCLLVALEGPGYLRAWLLARR